MEFGESLRTYHHTRNSLLIPKGEKCEAAGDISMCTEYCTLQFGGHEKKLE